MKKAKSCGIVPIFTEKNKIIFLLIKHKSEHGGHWDFPKGHVEQNESEEQTALREVAEETGLIVQIIQGYRAVINYIDKINNIDKTVVLFLGKSNSKKFNVQPSEIETAKWLSYDDAIKQLTFENSKRILRSAKEFLESDQASIEYSK